MTEPVTSPTNEPAPVLRPSRGRRWLFRLLLLLGLVAVTEASSYFTYWAVDGKPFSYRTAGRERHGLVPRGSGDAPPSPSHAGPTTETFHIEIHPFVGFSYDPTWPGKLISADPINDWGFTDKANRSPVRPRGPNKVVVAIIGASVASMFSCQGVQALENELRKSPQYSGKEIEFVSLAVGLYKQPQQLMALNYALALGAQFDVVINIDGLNDIAWYRQDNGAARVFHLYPLGWHSVVTDMPDPASRRQVGKIAYLSERRGDWARLFRKKPLRYSITANLVWKLRDRHMAADIANTEVALRSQRRDDLPYRARGPHNTYRNDEEMLAQLVEDWERCSLLIDRECKAHGMRYYHFLQPNQYVPGSKPLSPEERKMAIWDGLPARPVIERGYPLLREAGKRLAARGVAFHDLSMAFARSKETFYFDNCCHFNRAGNEVLAAAIAQTILETPEPPRAPEIRTSLKPALTGSGPRQNKERRAGGVNPRMQ